MWRHQNKGIALDYPTQPPTSPISGVNGGDQPQSRHAPQDSIAYAVPTALVIGFDLLGRAIAISAVVFTGAMVTGQGTGLALILLASLVGVIVTRALLSFPPSIVLTAQQAPIAALLPALAVVSTQGVAVGDAVATGLAIIGLTSVFTGVAIIVLARFDMGRMVRFLPYPVSTGFLAATGALLCFFALRSALDMGAGAPLSGYLPLALTFGMAAFLLLVQQLFGESKVAGGLVLAFGLFHGALAYLGADLATAQSWGLLHAAPRDGGFDLLPQVLDQVHVASVIAALPHALIAVMIAILANYLSIGAIEIGSKVDLAGPPAARMTGLANLLTGGLGGPVVFFSPSSSVAANLMRGNHPLMPVSLGLMLLVCVILAQDITGLVPSFLSGGLLVYLGGRILWLWLILPARQMPVYETILSAMIVVVSLLAGMLPAIMLGSVVAVILFAVTYSQLPVIRRQGSLAQWRSNVDRSGPEAELLDRSAAQVCVLQAEGFLFFGSVDQVTAALTTVLAPEPTSRTVIFDCGRVSGADAAICSALFRQATRGAQYGHRIFVAGGPANLQRGLGHELAAHDGAASLLLFPDLDQALERAEDDLIASSGGPAPDAETALRHLAGNAAPAILALMDSITLQTGQKLITAGEKSGDVFVLDRGRLGIYTRAPSGAALRLRIVRAGAIVGEMASYLNGKRTADVVAEETCQVLVMRADALSHLQSTAPETYAAWHLVMAQALAEKLMRTTRALAEQK